MLGWGPDYVDDPMPVGLLSLRGYYRLWIQAHDCLQTIWFLAADTDIQVARAIFILQAKR